jgi:hypothetical protein
MTAKRTDSASQQDIYVIRLRNHVDPDWADWFAGMTVAPLGDGEVLPLFRPIDLPESSENLEHKNSSYSR